MAKFFVEIKEVYTQRIAVEADSEDHAREVAAEVLNTGVQQDGTDLPNATVYDYTLDADDWTVYQ